MGQGKTIIIVLVTLVIGFSGGFLLRPVIAPAQQAALAATAPPAAPVSSEARGTQYFMANIDEARQVNAGCRHGPVRGGTCATAEKANHQVESGNAACRER